MDALTLDCGGNVHRLQVEEARLRLLDHDEREPIVEALGAPGVRCRIVAAAWEQYVPHDERAVLALGWPDLLSARALAHCDSAAAAMAALVGRQLCPSVGEMGRRLPADAARYVILRLEPTIGRAWAAAWAARTSAAALAEEFADEWVRGAACYLEHKLTTATT